ncbi:MAG: sulfate adenylyltransferase [Myxococcota bacterium]|jgi:sulfate adenylyltransferase
MSNIKSAPVHGGLDAPVNRVVPLGGRNAFLQEASGLSSAVVTNADLSTVYRIADGTLSPLEGPMGKAEWHKVLEDECIERGGKNYAWTIPLSLPITDEEAGAIKAGGSVAIRDEAGNAVAIVDEAEVFDYDKGKYVASVYGTDRMDHPGGRMTESDPRSKLLGGKLRAMAQPINLEYGAYMLSPLQSRALFATRKYDRVLAFQTRNPLHRAHEYALVSGAEDLTKAGNYTGVVLNPLMGELKGDDVPAGMRMETYRSLHSNRLLGKGDKDESIWKEAGYDISEVFELIGLDIKMFYGGPKEAVMHAIYRQNNGFTDIVIGRKHADAPYEDGKAIWGDFDAHAVFDNLKGELHILPCKIGFAAYYESIGRVDLMERHKDEKPISVSGTKIREQLQGGQHPDERIMRPETADLLIAAYKD